MAHWTSRNLESIMKLARIKKDWLAQMDLTLGAIETALSAVLDQKEKTDLVGLHLSYLFEWPNELPDEQVYSHLDTFYPQLIYLRTAEIL
jgi:hypothetical protein